MTHQSQVADASIVKIDNEKRLVFGWASIIKDESGKILLDRQDDFIDSEDELEKAAYDYVLHSRDGGEMHVRRGVAKMVESVVFTEEKQRALGIPVGSMPTGWWIGFKVNDDRVWEQVKKGEYAGFSVHGTGKRESTQLPVNKVTEIGKMDKKKKKNKISTVMEEFKAGKLKSSSGEPVTDPKQAMAIAISEQKRAKMKKIDIPEIVAKTEELAKANPNRDSKGRFASGGGSGGSRKRSGGAKKTTISPQRLAEMKARREEFRARGASKKATKRRVSNQGMTREEQIATRMAGAPVKNVTSQRVGAQKPKSRSRRKWEKA
jgi:hypothetical protein